MPSSPTGRLRSVVLASMVSAALGSAVGCEAILSPPQYGEVQVTMTTNTGEPVAGVAVSLYTGVRPIEYAFTDANGVYVFERVVTGQLYGVIAGIPRGFGDLTEGAYVVRDNLQVEPGMRREVAFTLVPCHGTLSVIVRDEAGRPAPGITAILYDAVGTIGTQTTAADGTTRFDGVSCGEFGVRLENSPNYVVTPGRGTSYADGLRVSRTTPAVSVSFVVHASAPATVNAALP